MKIKMILVFTESLLNYWIKKWISSCSRLHQLNEIAFLPGYSRKMEKLINLYCETKVINACELKKIFNVEIKNIFDN